MSPQDRTAPLRPLGWPRRYSVGARVAVVVGAVWLVAQAFSLVHRATYEQTDFSVFYRTAQALRQGVTAEFYAQRDEPTDLRHCIPPSGTMLFSYMPWLTIRGAAIVWGVFNLALLGFGAWCLWRIFSSLEAQRRLYQRTWAWAVFLLMALSTGGFQVGQFSLLFTTCWLGYLAVDGGFIAATMLMLPAAIKRYPALMWVLPLTLRRYRELPWLIPAGLLVLLALPLLVYGPQLFEMYSGFGRYMIASGTRVGDMYVPVTVSNQSLDLQALRYLTHQTEFQVAYPRFPHLSLDPAKVLAGVHVARLAILVVTGLAAWRLGSRARVQPRWTALLLMALWTATLYLLLPEAKSRYAAYLFPSLLPLLAMAAARRGHRRSYLGWCGLLALLVAALTQAVPEALLPYGPSLAATLLLWLMVLRLSWRAGAPALTGPADAGSTAALIHPA